MFMSTITTQFYKDNKGKHRWRIMSGNHKIIAAASEGFERIGGAENNLKLVGLAARGLGVLTVAATGFVIGAGVSILLFLVYLASL